jgi:hypothetical protein
VQQDHVAYVFIEARPGGSEIEGYVVKGHAADEPAEFGQQAKQSVGRDKWASAACCAVRHLYDKKKPDQWRPVQSCCSLGNNKHLGNAGTAQRVER